MRTLIVVFCVAACGGSQKPASPPPKSQFDAKALAAQLDAVMSEIEAATHAYEHDCASMVSELAKIETRARGPIEEARAAQQNPEQARALTSELRTYNQAAAGRSDVIAMHLAICYKQHPELDEQVQHVVDSMPTP